MVISCSLAFLIHNHKIQTLMDTKFVDTDGRKSPDYEPRHRWMQVLSCCPSGELKNAWSQSPSLHDVAFEVIRKPERGLVMVRGRAGSAGGKFNLGEMTVSRCAVRTPDGETGVSYVAGRDLDHALIAAKVDALLQSRDHHDAAHQHIIAPLEAAMAESATQRADKVAATRVNFFTMVRTREDKK